ncbi:DedA family protein [Candidatus Cryosericum odellii]|uniref:DedA family protein n=1 Tax=Candidatus Cryosericum odellii TaxID=2290917 RepID=A0A398DCK8_9BACT|nr:DedA family protein [Candidatus Cryosericum odellii]RIE08874.1 DedA family protein [Candidatus Cryosericum odellii]
MQHWIVQVMNQYGYAGIAFLVALENIFPPIPSEVILTFGGFMTTYTSLTYIGVVLFATVGSVLGAIVLYGLGRWLKPANLERFLQGKWGKALHINEGDVSKATAWFSRHGRPAVFFGRFIPIVRSLISIPAGIVHANMARFLALTIAGTLGWNAVLVYLGVLAGASWQKIVGYVGTYSTVVVLVLVILAVTAIFLFYGRKQTRIKNEHGVSQE